MEIWGREVRRASVERQRTVETAQGPNGANNNFARAELRSTRTTQGPNDATPEERKLRKRRTATLIGQHFAVRAFRAVWAVRRSGFARFGPAPFVPCEVVAGAVRALRP